LHRYFTCRRYLLGDSSWLLAARVANFIGDDATFFLPKAAEQAKGFIAKRAKGAKYFYEDQCSNNSQWAITGVFISRKTFAAFAIHLFPDSIAA